MKRIAGIAVLEATAILAVMAMLSAFVIAGAKKEMETAERMAMETQARAIGNALQLRMANLIGQRREREIVQLAQDNPVRWLSAPPVNYLGALDTAPAGETALGAWYFDAPKRELVYHVRLGDRLLPDSSGRRRVRFRVELVRENGGDTGAVVGAVFRPVESYRWR